MDERALDGTEVAPVRSVLPPEPSVSSDEREMLFSFLDYYRAVIRRKAEGLSDAEVRETCPPSTMNLIGMIKHLAFVEDYWFGHRLAGNEPCHPWDLAPWQQDPDWDWNSAIDDSQHEVFALFDKAVDASRSIQSRIDTLSAKVARPSAGEEDMTFRWILVHMIEEYARHAGHADLLREKLDGQTGD